MIRRSLFSTVALALLLASTAMAQNNTIRGKVRSANGETINDAIVELRVSGSGMIAQAVTRNDGDFAFYNLGVGEYEIAVIKAGYDQAVERARFDQLASMNLMETVRVEVTLRPRKDAATDPPGTSFAQDVPKAARAAYDKAVVRLREGKSEEAILLLREAIKLFDDYFDAHFALGKEMLRAGKDNEAIQSLERARQINDREAAVYHLFGIVMLKQRKLNVADYAFAEAERLNPNGAAHYLYRGQTLIDIAVKDGGETRRDRLGEAEKELTRAWDLSGKRLTAVHLQRARIYEQRGERERAARELEEYLKAEPDAKNAAAIRQAIASLRGNKN
jgi:tetratricopeptide (TPR) repeat protein